MIPVKKYFLPLQTPFMNIVSTALRFYKIDILLQAYEAKSHDLF